MVNARENSDDEWHARFATPVCVLGIQTESDWLDRIVFLPRSAGEQAPKSLMAEKVCKQLTRYLADHEFPFDVPARTVGPPQQRAVWAQMKALAPGSTMTYGEVARRLGSSPRAVGQACGANPIPVVVPCHRIVAREGIGGFAHRRDGFLLEIKQWLLSHERAKC